MEGVEEMREEDRADEGGRGRVFILLLLTTLARDVGDLGSEQEWHNGSAYIDRELGQ